MNLNAYDNVKLKINKQKTWIDIDKQQLLSREIKFRPYITLSKRFNVQNKSYEYFLLKSLKVLLQFFSLADDF